VKDQTTLAACPFCGETHALTVDNLAGDDWYVECGACKVQQHAIYPTFGAAVAAWNRRASANGDVSAYIASLVAERDELRQALRGMVVMLPADAPERDENERLPASFVAITWKELRAARKALSAKEPT
jgi:Lar family restriction alleviation protein